MKRKGCPDRQTAACLDGVSFEALAVRHPPRHFVALSPSRGRMVQRHNLLFPLEGKCRVSGKRGYEAACRDEAQRLP